ncbi:MAG: hypothetical protein QOJ42_4990 [Acidobacteriaceae bacterium]|jgi:hypothetical protein|nr:hypothetical protein [Acidobacteriaceae bacterium]
MPTVQHGMHLLIPNAEWSRANFGLSMLSQDNDSSPERKPALSGQQPAHRNPTFEEPRQFW